MSLSEVLEPIISLLYTRLLCFKLFAGKRSVSQSYFGLWELIRVSRESGL